MYKKIFSLLGVVLVLFVFVSQVESECQVSCEWIVEQVFKLCEGKKVGDKVVIIDCCGGEYEVICILMVVLLLEQCLLYGVVY